MTAEEMEKVRAIEKEHDLAMEVFELYMKCQNVDVLDEFNYESTKNLERKKEFLKRVNDGESPKKVDKNYHELIRS